jgi:hypothetical protein
LEPTLLYKRAGVKMFRKSILGAAIAMGLALNVSAAEVYVRVAPPRAVVEHRPARPGRDYVWLPGYHRWDGHRHVWVEGRWERPPHRHARWERHHWEHRREGWVLVEGRWR